MIDINLFQQIKWDQLPGTESSELQSEVSIFGGNDAKGFINMAMSSEVHDYEARHIISYLKNTRSYFQLKDGISFFLCGALWSSQCLILSTLESSQSDRQAKAKSLSEQGCHKCKVFSI